MKEIVSNDHLGKKCWDRSIHFLWWWILIERHERGHQCSYCKEIESNHGFGAKGLWIPGDKTGWWVLWSHSKDFNKFIRIT